MQVTLGRCANNGPKMKPVLIITRPAPDAARFAADVTARVDATIIISPLQKIVPVDAVCDAAAVLFTSSNGVAQAARMGVTGLRAWCVGDRTAQQAQKAGFDALSAGGSAEDLIALILAEKPTENLTHIRGRETRGDIAPRLTAAGFLCADLIVYEQEALALSPAAISAIEGPHRVIIPLFSPRAATLLSEQVTFGPRVEFIAMSKTVADRLGDRLVQVLDVPNGNAMIAAVIAACRNVQAM